jgi:peptidyl-tRNA hydrolase
MNSPPYFLTMLNTILKYSLGGTMKPPAPWMVSAMKAGTPEFVRVRVGIGRPAPGLEAKDHVLHAMGRTELEAFKASIARAAEAVEAVVTNGLERAMNQYNQRA